MTDTEQLTFIRRVLTAVDSFDCEELLWRVDGEQVKFMVKCSDVFAWGCADCEEVTPDNVAVLEQSYADTAAACKFGTIYAQELFCCRVRKMRPQGACYPEKEGFAALWPLFDACGPERETSLGNPYQPGSYTSKIVSAAVAEEREACAKIAETMESSRIWHVAGRETTAAAIRKRGQP